jgi:peptidoglycan/LPS O-acetylase OafA/YrhL
MNSQTVAPQMAPILHDNAQMPPATVTVAPTSSAKAQRIPALDFTKGALVLIMVLYHWLNYFVGPQADVYRYLRFLTPSFIFITGFLVSSVYLSKYGVSSPQLPRRLIERGLKILGVFVGLNVVRTLLLPPESQAQLLAEHSSIRSLTDIYVIGTNLGGGQGKAIAFYVLVPIGYLLILSALLLIGARYYRYFYHFVFAVSLLSVLALDSFGTSSANLQLLTIGLLGVILGYIPIDKINRFVKHPFLVALGYLGYLYAIKVWNVMYPLQIVGVCLSLAILYLMGDAAIFEGRVRNVIILLGQYSLLGYIAQIAVLQVLHQGLRHTELGIGSALGVSFFAAIALTILIVDATDRGRRRFVLVNRLYKTVFA